MKKIDYAKEEIYVIINALATKIKKKLIKKGGIKNQKGDKKLRQQFEKFGVVEITYNLEELGKTLSLNYDPSKILGLVGGDGSFHKLVTFLINSGLVKPGEPLPIMAPLEGGGMNILARTLGFKDYPQNNLEKIYYSLASPQITGAIKEIVQLPLLKVEANFLKEPIYGFIFMVGPMIIEMMERYHQKGTGPKNTIKTALEILTMIAKGDYSFARQAEFDLLIDNLFHHQRKYLTVAISSLNQLFFNFRIFEGDQLISGPRGFFTLIEPGPAKVVSHNLLQYLFRPQFSRLTGKGYWGNGQTINSLVKNIEIKGKGKDGDFTIDGDFYKNFSQKDFFIKISEGPKARLLKLIEK